MKVRRNRKLPPVVLGVAALVVVVGGLYAYSHLTAKPQVLGAAATAADRNAARKASLEDMAAALSQYEAAHAGRLPYAVAARDTGICSSTGAMCKAAKLADLSFLPDLGYMQTLPADPVGGPGQFETGYAIGRDPATGKIRLSAPRAELGAVINVTLK